MLIFHASSPPVCVSGGQGTRREKPPDAESAVEAESRKCSGTPALVWCTQSRWRAIIFLERTWSYPDNAVLGRFCLSYKPLWFICFFREVSKFGSTHNPNLSRICRVMFRNHRVCTVNSRLYPLLQHVIRRNYRTKAEGNLYYHK
jgi:hypothetical protein